MESQFIKTPHRRYNPLTGEWLLLSPQRTSRPWEGKTESIDRTPRPQHDPNCYLCAGNKRAGGQVNPEYKGTLVFDNDFPALKPEHTQFQFKNSDLFRVEPASGTCKVICFSDRHDLSLAEMNVEEIKSVIRLWQEQSIELGKQFQWVQLFENKGEVMGCSNQHPHGQIWASSFLPEEPRKEDEQQKQYFEQYNRVMLADYVAEELELKERIIFENSGWVCLIPFWAIWPFEVIVIPKRHTLRLDDLNADQTDGLAELLKVLLVKYDNIFNTSFPYSMGWHGAPNNGGNNQYWQLHAHYYPPLLRSATVKKFMVGYEMLGNAQRDITPEQAASVLREQSSIHYKQQET